jgi:hypothetical protein
MALKAPLTVNQARAMAQRVTIGRAKYKGQYSPPHSTAELAEALTVLEASGNWDAPTKAELTKANRQLAACNARLTKAKLIVVPPLQAATAEDGLPLGYGDGPSSDVEIS